jgi:uncharacterized membrane protein
MGTIEASVDVEVPVRMAYNQWTQFESFPRFMDSVIRVDRLQSTMTHWVTRCGGVSREFDAEIMEQRPDEHLAWRSLDTPCHSGTVTFLPRGDDLTRVTVSVEFAPQGIVERAGHASGAVRRMVQADLNSFKDFIEGQGCETGGWRGSIGAGRVRPDSGQDRPDVPDWPVG